MFVKNGLTLCRHGGCAPKRVPPSVTKQPKPQAYVRRGQHAGLLPMLESSKHVLSTLRGRPKIQHWRKTRRTRAVQQTLIACCTPGKVTSPAENPQARSVSPLWIGRPIQPMHRFRQQNMGRTALVQWKRLAHTAMGGGEAIKIPPDDHRFTNVAWQKHSVQIS